MYAVQSFTLEKEQFKAIVISAKLSRNKQMN